MAGRNTGQGWWGMAKGDTASGAAMALARVGARGQVTIPVRFRKALGIEAGCTLVLQQVGNRKFMVEVIPLRTIDDFPTVDVIVDMHRIREEMGQEIADRVYPGDVET